MTFLVKSWSLFLTCILRAILDFDALSSEHKPFGGEIHKVPSIAYWKHLVLRFSFSKIHERLIFLTFLFQGAKDRHNIWWFSFQYLFVLAPPGPPHCLAGFSHLKHNEVNRIIFQVPGQHLLQLNLFHRCLRRCKSDIWFYFWLVTSVEMTNYLWKCWIRAPGVAGMKVSWNWGSTLKKEMNLKSLHFWKLNFTWQFNQGQSP